ncbi:DUF418 domain-containing protein [Altibacter sp. HG106]|uniref:DUF418 domain-containing protein n=1 Tax=Altibacter sp. HG106 TaxID=3023937 RepID=UPI002350FD91|nr:DUF418 domain-containing protein [Altibacter sp. HG106]MDC7995672.1 DUF418 domain-containing protein [Altibacter sp. HG106]
MNETSPIRPTKKTQRITLLDVYRGFAILGIFVVNITVMHSTYLNQDVYNAQWTASIDVWTQRILQLFFYTKFFPIFSLLFGWGMAMQALKMKEKQGVSLVFFARRMGYLWLFGVLHIAFLWSGDVLHLYAVLGLLITPLIVQRSTLLIWLSVILLVFPFYDTLLSEVFTRLSLTPESTLSGYDAQSVREIIRQGSFSEGIQLRFREYVANLPMLLGYLAPMALSMFLLGLYLGKMKIHLRLSAVIQSITIPMLAIAILSNAYRLVFLFVLPEYELYRDPQFRPYFIKLMVVCDVLMGLFYLWCIGWLWYRKCGRPMLRPLRFVGRMALTHYLFQSAIGVWLFTAVGLSNYETFRPYELFGIALLVFILQIFLSKVWLRYFRFGPVEWIWRCATYGKWFPLRKR